ncbi:hypothetical protein RclHR1_30170001 [Rhizophagus clarus]|uniref:Uncharacterized protein n=1 Tax=Rhizophagus clarus TaxID=94130 RepID=A0A2Z6RLP1_9GLOM|nr:hypothetical protein RclHR1_30170001 [Rhizophagus clarus]
MIGIFKHQTKALLRDLLIKLPQLCEGITVATARAAELFDNFADYRIDLGLSQHKPKASTQQIVAANILGTLCHLFSAAFLDTVIFPTLDQLSHPPDDSPKMDMNMEVMHQSKDVLSTLSPPSPPITVEQPDSWTKTLTKNQKKKLKKKARAAEKITFLQENSSLSFSTASPDSPLASHAQKPVEPTNSRSVIPPTRQASKNDKDLDRSKKRSKIQDSFTGINNCIITDYQSKPEESQLLLDLIVYDISAKWSNYKFLTNLNS